MKALSLGLFYTLLQIEQLHFVIGLAHQHGLFVMNCVCIHDAALLCAIVVPHLHM